MKLDKLKGVIAKIAPAVGAAIGGPLGGVAGKFIQDALGLDNEEAVITALQTDPNALLSLKVAELKMQEFMRDADLREMDLERQDTADARAMARATGVRPQVVFTVIVLCGVLATLYGLATGVVNETQGASKEIVYMIVGAMTTTLATQMQFWFGTSLGSSRKTDILAQREVR